MDPWQVTRHERMRFETHFQAMKPINGIVTGDQVKGFLMQSGLPVATLGKIWSLADTDADGKMNINEFVIACKLISNNLRGFDIPPTLPISLMQSIAGKGSCPTSPLLTGPSVPQIPSVPRPAMPPAPAAMVRPIIPAQPLISGAVPQAIPQVGAPPGSISGSRHGSVQGSRHGSVQGSRHGSVTSPIASSMVSPPNTMAPSPAMPLIPGVTSPLTGGVPVLPTGVAPGIPPAPSAITSPIANTGVPTAITMLTPPGSTTPDKPPAPVESPLGGPPLEWAVPHQSKLKYTQLFNTTDRTRSGFLSGPQARNIMVATQLSQPILAQIWNLADMDSDGQLSCDEFVLAMHLCDLAKSGDKIPVPLPIDLIPPTFRRQRQNSLTVTNPGSDVVLDPMAGMGQTTFEDKRKENYEKGQAELERRRKALLEIQKKEQEERERKEREEHDKREKLRLEQEAKRQAEIDMQLMKQRELEQAKEEERKRAQEQRDAARREMERQRQLEWEKQRIQELTLQRQKEQETVLKLKAKNQTLGIELSSLNDKVKDLSTKITETRVGVTGIKNTIDSMRASRDVSMQEMSSLKAKLKEQNQRLINLSHEKAKLEAKTKSNPGAHADDQEQTNILISKKQIAVKNLKNKITELEEQFEAKQKDLEAQNIQLEDVTKTLADMIGETDTIYNVYAEKRNIILDMKESTRGTSNSWGDTAWESTPAASDAWPASDTNGVAVSEYKRYRAIYEFVSRNGDELSFQPGDTIMVPVKQNAEPGWLAGELRGKTGWFPESYVEPLDETGDIAAVDATANAVDKHHLELIAEVPENISDSGSGITEEGPGIPSDIPSPIMGLGSVVSQQAQVLYSYSAKKGSQLSFNKGDIVNVTETQEFWWYGELGGAEGWFPKTYVKLIATLPAAAAVVVPTAVADIPVTNGADLNQGEYYIAVYPYESHEPGDLTFNQDEVVYVTKKEGDWWTGTIGDRIGLFPSNYVVLYEAPPEVIPKPVVVAKEESKPVPIQTEVKTSAGEKRSETPDFSSLTAAQLEQSSKDYESEMEKAGTPKSKKAEIASVIAPYQATSSEQLSLSRGQLIMIRKKTTTGWWEGELQAKGKKRQVGWFPASYVKVMGGAGAGSKSASPKPDQPQSQERVLALYDYTALNEDELSFVKDDIITIIAKDEAEWWRGQLKGQSGLFPSNYTTPLYGEFIISSNEEKKRQQCIRELIETEQAYIEDMCTVHEVFEKPLKDSGILTKEDLRQIFVNWKEIIGCNHMFLRALRVRRDMSQNGQIRKIGDILCEHLPRMTAYVRFCSCQLSAAALIQKLTDNSPEFKNICKKCQSDPRTKGMPLSSFLIKPMQRITKYPLLIEKILEQTPTTHSDSPYLQEALAKAEEFCIQVNEGVREKENSDRLEWLQTHIIQNSSEIALPETIVFNSLTNSIGPRKFLHHGVLTKTKSGKELCAFLLNDMLLLTQGSNSSKNLNQISFDSLSNNVMLKLYKQPLLLNEINIHSQVGDDSSTEIKLEHNKTTIISLSTSSPNERSLWIKKLGQAQKEVLAGEKTRIQKQLYKQSNFGAVGRLLVVVAEGYKIKPPTNKRSIFCQVTMGSQEHTTSVIALNTLEPKWNSSMQFLIKDVREDVLCITVFDKGHYSPDEFLGRSEMRIYDIFTSKAQQHGPINKMLKLYQVNTGEILLKLDLHLFNK